MAKRYIIAIDLGGTNLKLGLFDLKYKIIAKSILNTRQFRSKDSLILAIVDAINGFLKSRNLSKQEVLGVGMGLPGPIDVKRGLVHFFPNIPGWKEVNLKSILEKKLSLPVFLDNDANLMSLAEYKLGAAKNTTNAICITLGTGVGGGIIIDGKLYRASAFAAGEFGHVPINESGPQCNCGGIACLETYIGNNRIMALVERTFGRRISLEDLSALAKRKNQKAVKIWLEVGTHLGVALVGVVNMLNPDCIVIGGGVANAGKILFDQVKTVIRKRAMLIQAKHVKVFKAKLGYDAGLIGAAILVRENI
ncbi:MAG: ROK family protein [Candidatus Omnitrophica bacterium]|nr:ROK family protein [Candidatus Omnitrophota bacterium]